MSIEEKMEADGRSIYVGNVSKKSNSYRSDHKNSPLLLDFFMVNCLKSSNNLFFFGSEFGISIVHLDTEVSPIFFFVKPLEVWTNMVIVSGKQFEIL